MPLETSDVVTVVIGLTGALILWEQIGYLKEQIKELRRQVVSDVHVDLARQAEVTNEFFWKEKVRYAVMQSSEAPTEITEDTKKEIIALHFQLHLLQTAFRGLKKNDPKNWYGYERWFLKIILPWSLENPQLVPFLKAIVNGEDLFTDEFVEWLKPLVTKPTGDNERRT